MVQVDFVISLAGDELTIVHPETDRAKAYFKAGGSLSFKYRSEVLGFVRKAESEGYVFKGVELIDPERRIRYGY